MATKTLSEKELSDLLERHRQAPGWMLRPDPTGERAYLNQRFSERAHLAVPSLIAEVRAARAFRARRGWKDWPED